MNVLLVCKASGGWRPVLDLKQLNHHIDAPHFRMHTISSVLSTVEKGDCVQNISAGCILSCTDSKKQEVPTVSHSKTRYTSFELLSTSLRSEQCSPGFYTPWTYSGSLPPLSRDIGNSISRRLADTSPRPPSITSPPVSVTKHTEYGRPQVKRRQIRTRTSSG